MENKILRIASRNSPLAVRQSEIVAQQLRMLFPELSLEIVGMTTTGDQNLSAKLDTLGGKGLFIKELEIALLEGRCDFAVHSAKDLPVELHDDLRLVAVSARADARDAVVSASGASLAQLPPGSVVGTSSARRSMLVQHWYPHLRTSLLRGNVQTRLAKLAAGDFDAIILAAAGLERLGLSHQVSEFLPVDKFIPAVGQGILALESTAALAADPWWSAFNHADSWDAWQCERAFMLALGGGCSAALAAHAQVRGDQIFINGAWGHGAQVLFSTGCGSRTQAALVGRSAAQQILTQMEKL